MATHNANKEDSGTGESEKFIVKAKPKVPSGVKENQKWRYIAIVLTIVTECLLITLVTLTVCWRQGRFEPLDPNEVEVCAPCSHLQPSTDDDKTEFAAIKEYPGNRREAITNCCGVQTALIDITLKKFTRLKFNEEKENRENSMSFPDCNNHTLIRPSAKVAGIALNKMQKNADNSTLIHWNISHPSFLHSDIVYSEGHFVIGTPRYYFVFTQVKISDGTLSSQNGSESRSNIVFSHEMHVRNHEDGTSKKMLGSFKSPFDTVSSERDKTSSIGAVFHLNKDDRVYVTTSHPKMLVSCQNSNVFSLYMI